MAGVIGFRLPRMFSYSALHENTATNLATASISFLFWEHFAEFFQIFLWIMTSFNTWQPTGSMVSGLFSLRWKFNLKYIHKVGFADKDHQHTDPKREDNHAMT